MMKSKNLNVHERINVRVFLLKFGYFKRKHFSATFITPFGEIIEAHKTKNGTMLLRAPGMWNGSLNLTQLGFKNEIQND